MGMDSSSFVDAGGATPDRPSIGPFAPGSAGGRLCGSRLRKEGGVRKSILAAGLLVGACAAGGGGPPPTPAPAPEPAAEPPQAPPAAPPTSTEPEALRSLFGPEYDEALSAIGLT